MRSLGKFGSIHTTDKLFQTRFEFVSPLHREEGRRVPTREAIRNSQTEKPLGWAGWNFFTRLIRNISVNIDLFLRKSSLRLYSFRIVSAGAKMNLKEQYKIVKWIIVVSKKKKIWNMKIASNTIDLKIQKSFVDLCRRSFKFCIGGRKIYIQRNWIKIYSYYYTN